MSRRKQNKPQQFVEKYVQEEVNPELSYVEGGIDTGAENDLGAADVTAETSNEDNTAESDSVVIAQDDSGITLKKTADDAAKSLAKKTCEYCGAVKKSPADLQRHLRSHTGEKPFICNICERAFKVKRSLQYHQFMDHGIVDADCNIAKKLSGARKRKIQLTEARQLRSTTTAAKCAKTAEEAPSEPHSGSDSDDMPLSRLVADHEERENGDDDGGDDGDDSDRASPSGLECEGFDDFILKPGERVCKYCDKICQKPSDLKRHLMCHTGEKPFTCRVCQKAFRARASLLYHIKVNHDAKVELSQGLQERYDKLKLRPSGGLDSLGSSTDSSDVKMADTENMNGDKLVSVAKTWTPIEVTTSRQPNSRIMVSLLNPGIASLSLLRSASSQPTSPSQPEESVQVSPSSSAIKEEKCNGESNGEVVEPTIRRAPRLSIGGAKQKPRRNGFVFHSMGFHEVNGRAVATKKTVGYSSRSDDLPASTPSACNSVQVTTRIRSKNNIDLSSNDIVASAASSLGLKLSTAAAPVSTAKENAPSLNFRSGSVLGPRVIVKEEKALLSCLESEDVATGQKTFFYKCHGCRTLFQTYSRASDHYAKVHLAINNNKILTSASPSPTADTNNQPVFPNIKAALSDNPGNADVTATSTSRAERLRTTCRYCKKKFTKPFAMRRHERIHTGEKHCYCRECGKGFSERRNLRQHVIRFHNNTMSRVNSLKKRAIKAAALKQNGDAKPKDAKPFIQHVTVKTEEVAPSGENDDDDDDEAPPLVHPNHSNLRALIANTPAPSEGLTVQSSSGIWVPPSGLDDLVDEMRNPVTVIVGVDSDKPKTTSLSRTNSRLTVVKEHIDRYSVCQPSVSDHGVQLYTCPFCAKQFANSADLNRHLDFHEDRRPFKCKFCDYCARTKSQLKVHMMRHQGIRAYTCDLCNYSCVTQSDLNRHRKSRLHHMREEKTCVVCGQQFSHFDLLRKHMEETHPDDANTISVSEPARRQSKLPRVASAAANSRSKNLLSCTACGLCFTSRHALLHHYNQVHENEEPDFSSLLKLGAKLNRSLGDIDALPTDDVLHSDEAIPETLSTTITHVPNPPLFPVPEIAGMADN